MPTILDALQGIVVETKTTSPTSELFYSDNVLSHLWTKEEDGDGVTQTPAWCQIHFNAFAKRPIQGILAGITRMALAIIHTIGHLFAGLVTFDKGHLYHAAKGACEFVRGFIEAIPIVGRIFANQYKGDWWILKIYNPDAPDSLDLNANLWRPLKQFRPTSYVKA